MKKDLKTKYIPALVMLVAGLLYCIIAIRYRVKSTDFLIRLLAVLLIFYFLGTVVRIVIDVNFRNFFEIDEASEGEAEEEGEAEDAEEVENIDMDADTAAEVAPEES